MMKIIFLIALLFEKINATIYLFDQVVRYERKLSQKNVRNY